VIDGSNSQNLSNIYGKVLRINVDNPTNMVPADNPFVNVPGDNPYIYAYGFRNAFRLTFTPTGQLLVADVGQNAWEEVDNVVAGGNYGWPNAEGPCNGIGVSNCSTPSSYINPIFAFNHNGGTAAITGVMVYTGPGTSSSAPTLLFADFTGAGGTVTSLLGGVGQTTCAADYSSCGNPSGPPTWQWNFTPFTSAAPGRPTC
jgi:aldose sugar dehydrogenase